MNYYSTRNRGIVCSSAEAILQGMAKDGGLFVPEVLPTFDFAMFPRDYRAIAEVIFVRFFTDFSRAEIREMIEKAYQRFDAKEVCKVTPVGDRYMLELWHGPTMAFKDIALQMLPLLMQAAKEKEGRKEKTLILTATSGDTGKAAMEGFSGVEDMFCLVFYPLGRVSAFQERQMLTRSSKNVKAFALEGDFDDCQRLAKRLLFEKSLEKEDLRLSSANSINIGRLIPQTVYYIYAYLALVQSGKLVYGDLLDVSVPTGNFGNILAAIYAKEMGLPLGTITCASNANNVLYDFLTTGIYDRRRKLVATSSPSMDILVASNLERYLSLLLKDPKKVCSLMQDLSEEGVFALNNADFPLRASWASEDEITAAIKEAYALGYYLDPHTACAWHAVKKETLIVSTASPYKFGEKMTEALGVSEFGKKPQALIRMQESTPQKRSIVSIDEAEKAVVHFLEAYDEGD